MALAACLTAQADYLFTTQFSSGRVPAIMTATAGEDASEVVTGVYSQGTSDKGWSVVMVSEESSYAAVCASYTGTDKPMQSVLSCPQVTVTGTRPMLRWKARSVYPSFPEAYKVTVLEDGAAEPAVVYSTDEAPGEWTNYAVDLTEWIGKKVTISFTCVSVNKYMLAVDDIYVGDPEDVRYIGKVTSPVYVGNETATTVVAGTVGNFGKPLASGRLVCRYGDNEESIELPDYWQCGQSFDFEFNLPVTLNGYTDFTIGVCDAADEYTQVLADQVFCSYFPRTLLVDEFTGMWCNNCPKGQIELEKLERQFGKQVITLGVHVNDIFQNDEYFEAFRIYSVPWLLLNRDPDLQGEGSGSLKKGYAAPTKAKIEITGYKIDGDRLDVQTRVQWAEDLDNNGDRYRIAYTLTRDIRTSEYIKQIYQENSCRNVKYERFNVLPTTIPSYLTQLDHVVLYGEFSHKGRPYTIPAKLTANQPVEGEFYMLKPAVSDKITWPSVRDFEFKDCRVVAYIVDSTTGVVLNACEQYLDEPVSVGIGFPAVGGFDEADGEPEYYNLQGIRVANPESGIYIVRRGSKVSKTLID